MVDEGGRLVLSSDVRLGGAREETLILNGEMIGVYNLTLPDGKIVVLGANALSILEEGFVSPSSKLSELYGHSRIHFNKVSCIQYATVCKKVQTNWIFPNLTINVTSSLLYDPCLFSF